MSPDAESHAHTPADAAARLVEAAVKVRAALVDHAAAIVAADGDPARFAAADDLLAPALRALDEAYAAITGEVHPMRADEIYAAAEGCGGNCACAGTASDEELIQITAAEETGPAVVSVFQRHDYAIADPEAVIAAGREAYLKTSPEASAEQAADEVSDVDLALLHLAHTDGWNNLWQLEGLDAVGGVTGVVEQADPLAGDPEEWADDVLGGVLDDTEPLFVQVDVYGE